jgi:hypothetical protein
MKPPGNPWRVGETAPSGGRLPVVALLVISDLGADYGSTTTTQV